MFYCNVYGVVARRRHKGCIPKNNVEETLVHTEGRGVKKSPFLSSSRRGHILVEGEVKIFLSEGGGCP